MSKPQRRDHAAIPKGDGDVGWCIVCKDPIHEVYDRNLPVTSRRYWRHTRRWHVMPAALRYPRRTR